MEQKQEYDAQFKIILLGDNFVGKSCLLQSYFGEVDLYSYTETLGIDQKIKLLNVFNKTLKLRIWDACGTPKLRNLVASYVKSADAALICFDMTNIASFRNIKSFIEDFRANEKNAPIFLIGCKSDLTHQRKVSEEEALDLAEQLGLTYMNVSALKKINVEKVFEQIAQQLYFLVQLKKVKPLLEEPFGNYLKLDRKRSRSNLFSTPNPNLSKEVLLREMHQRNLEQLFQAKKPHAVNDFCIKTIHLVKQANHFFINDNPGWSLFTISPLARVLKQTLNFLLRHMPSELVDLSQLRELLHQDKMIKSLI